VAIVDRYLNVVREHIFPVLNLLNDLLNEEGEGVTKTFDQLSTQINTTIVSIKELYGAAAVVVPSRGIVSTSADFPFADRNKIAGILPLELQDRLPFDTSEMNLSFVVQEQAEPNGSYPVIVTICPRVLSARINKFVRSFGLNPLVILPRSAALLSATELSTSDRFFLVVFEPGDDIQVTLIDSGRMRSSTTLVARDAWADEKLGTPDALRFGREVLGAAYVLVGSNSEASRSPNIDPAQIPIVFAGPEHLCQALREVSPLVVERRELGGAQIYRAAARTLLSAEQRRVAQNFGEPDFWSTFPFGRISRASRRLIVPVVILLLSLFLILAGEMLMYRTELSRIQYAMTTQISEQLRLPTTPELEGVDRSSRLLAQVSQRVGRIQGELNAVTPAIQARPLRVIEALNRALSDPGLKSISIRSLTLRDAGLTIVGTGDSYLAVDRLRNTLRRQPMFDSVRDATAGGSAGQRRGEIAFSLSIQVNPSIKEDSTEPPNSESSI
jgi:hypothetical protein